ncbi:uncharacterized protein KY384_003023 [Bacidia gigantensis]|uniref:uncharacterized protein n=1 Tax=Bacidia gigantensis TaxID=2732470 RepID=UPI001D04F9C8|nr:uncharacterized protein KY384_003023 [Bacidia gigantensis]KAG8531394.1 hypothetical protein KY384_003023 [Bacidia gigantensis]
MFHAVLATLPLLCTVLAQCPGSPNPVNDIEPITASGWKWSVVSTNISNPRSLQFDSAGRLIVLQSGHGITALTLEDDGGNCVGETSRKVLKEDASFNHGLALSADGRTIYASSSEAAFSWPYDPANAIIGADATTLVRGMDNTDHNTRTLLISPSAPNNLVVSRGSNANIDPGAADVTAGRSQIKAFDLTKLPTGGYDFITDGLRLGWGLRNSVGVAEHPVTHGIYSVENSVDEFDRDGVDVHQDNPGEEMNFHGTILDNAFKNQGGSYGYPNCFAAWLVSALPNNEGLVTGSPFSNSSKYDYLCEGTIAPVMTFGAHKAPLDIKFNNSGTEGWVSFHGSWDRDAKTGYKISYVPFVDGQPRAVKATNPTNDIFHNADVTRCPGNCFRPTGMTFDSQGRLFMSSDYSGEIYVVARD